MIEASRGDAAGSARNEAVLYVRDMAVSPRYDGAGFVYRLGEAEYTTDFYNRFLTSPDLLVTQEVRDWMLDAGLFGQVIHGGSLVSPTHALEGRVNALYGDYSVQPSKAVLEIELFLVEDPLKRSGVLFHERYREEIPLDDRSPKSLVRGWNTGLAAALGKLERDLGSVQLRSGHAESGP